MATESPRLTPDDLSQRELHAYLVATSALLHAMDDRVEQLGEGKE